MILILKIKNYFYEGNVLYHFTQNILKTKYHYHESYCTQNLSTLCGRGIFEDIFPKHSCKDITNLLSEKPQCVYAGFDPTSNSLHVGSLAVLVNLLHWQRAGHYVIALIGCATTQIGDPSGHNRDREEEIVEIVRERAFHIRKSIEGVFLNHEKYIWNKIPNSSPLHPIRFVDNEEWYKNVNIIDFLSSIGRNFRVGAMLQRDRIGRRLQSQHGLNFAEFTYQMFQANDWLHLFNTYKCRFQVGGNDQMGNIVAGHNLIGRVLQQPVYGLTLPLVTTDAGDKFGKSLPNAVWLDETLTSPFDFYQFFMRTEDSKVEKLLKLFTFLSLNDVEQVMEKHLLNPELRMAQKKLAEEATVLVHGEDGLKIAKTASSILYGKNIELLGQLSFQDLNNVLRGVTTVTLPWRTEYTVLQFTLDIPCFFTTSDALRIISAGGLYINFQKVRNPNEVLTHIVHVLPNNTTIVRVGKKHYWIIKWCS